MTVAAQPIADDDGPLSPWWMRAVLIVMVLGFAGLMIITTMAQNRRFPSNSTNQFEAMRCFSPISSIRMIEPFGMDTHQAIAQNTPTAPTI